MKNHISKSFAICALMFVSMFSLSVNAAPAKTGTATCAGKALDGTVIELKFCFKVPTSSRWDGVIRNACDGKDRAVLTTINGETEDYGSISKLTIFESMYVDLTTINDGRETHSAISYSTQEHDRAWNTMKVTSVKTGTKYLVADFTCTVLK